jgi:hypothetical protein
MAEEPSRLEREYATYLREKLAMLAAGKEGRWLVIYGDNIDSDWSSLAEAANAGYDRFWPALFMVKCVLAQEPVVRLPSCFWGIMARINGTLAADGPLIEVSIAVCSKEEEMRLKDGATVQPPAIVMALLDTGTNRSWVDTAIIQSLGLREEGQTTSGTLGEPTTANYYMTKITIKNGGETLLLDPWPVLGRDFKKDWFRAILGRDVLAGCVFSYHGKDGKFTLDFEPTDPPEPPRI